MTSAKNEYSIDSAINDHMVNILSTGLLFEKQFVKDSIVRKSSANSEEVRKTANIIYSRKHGKKDHIRILALYSKSIALAPESSKQLALAYSNRSALLKHLNFPEKSLIDIDRALKITNSDNLKIKLLARKTECLKLKDELDKSGEVSSLSNKIIGSDKQFILVSKTQEQVEFPIFTPSQKIPCAAESITIDYNKNIGRHLIATRDIKPGEVIIVEEGYVIFPKVDKMYLFCSHCLALAWNGIPCDQCALALYCSEDCKSKALNEYHDVECSILPFMLSKAFSCEGTSVFAVMTSRFFIRAVKSEGLENIIADSRLTDDVDGLHMEGLLSNGIYDNEKFKFCYNLLAGKKNTEPQKLQILHLYAIVNLLLKHTNLLDKYKIINNGNMRITNQVEVLEIQITLEKIWNILNLNIHTFQGSLCDCDYYNNCDDTCTGKGGSILASFSSLINHSCHPNISRMFLPNRKIVIFTTCPVKKGEQLCDTYGPTVRYNCKIERQQYLLRNYHFICLCQACTDDWSIELNKSVLRQFRKSNPKWYKNRYLNKHNVEDWPYNEATMKEVVKASELAYNTFDQNRAYVLSIPCRCYIEYFFYKLYGDDYCVPNNC